MVVATLSFDTVAISTYADTVCENGTTKKGNFVGTLTSLVVSPLTGLFVILKLLKAIVERD